MELYEEFFISNLETLSEEISMFQNEADLWKLSGSLNNTCGNLAMHLCGNLKHFIGFGIGMNGYIRNRDLEFSIKGLSKEDILSEIKSTSDAISPVLEKLTKEDLLNKYEYDFFGDGTTIDYVLMRLASHFTYHLGQINYFRRLL